MSRSQTTPDSAPIDGPPAGPPIKGPEHSATPTGKGTSPIRPLVRRVFAREELGITTVLVVLVVFIGVVHPNFLAQDALLGLIRSAAFVALIAFGMVFLLAMTELDLSVGSVFGLSALISGQLMANGMPPWLALLTGPLIGMLLEAVNAFFANTFRIPVIIVTLGTLTAFRGLATVVTHSQAIAGLPLDSSFFKVLGGNLLGIPTAVVVVVIVGALMTVAFRRTPFGARVRAVGSNQAAARFSGIKVGRTRLQALLLVGALCGLSGVLGLAYFQGADPTLGSGLELQVIAAVIIGGTAVTGGSGSVPGALIGALVIVTISGGLVYFSVDPSWSGVVTGATILVAVSADGVVRRRRAIRQARAGG